jgi:putative two-component system response regulator
MSGEKVLVVEDNVMNMELVLVLLTQAGYSVLQAVNAEAGIELAKRESPRLILMDVSLPGMDGLTAVSILKRDSETKEIPIIVMTAHAMRGDDAKARQAGSDAYLTKPINTREFLQMVAQFIEPKNIQRKEPEHLSEHMDKPKSILIVDDDESNRDLLEGLLEVFGHRTESVKSGLEALTYLQASDVHEKPDLVLLDVMMPGMNGFDVARAIRQDPALSDLPIIMVTALTDREDRLRAVEAGANDFISKPIDKTELRVRITSLLKIKEAQDIVKQHQAQLEETVKQRTQALQRAMEKVIAARQEADAAHLDTIYRLAAASEYKDKDTATHIRRVTSYCDLLARHLGLPEEEREALCVASPMHDVGKLGIPDAILLKPGKLNPEEWAIMQKHTTIGAHILDGSSSTVMRAGQIIALSHHERWDGSGYPHGLAGTDIPLWGRICALADVFDALTNERPYKKAFTNEQAFEIMKAERGHFDPDLLELFLQIKDEIIAVQLNEE